MEVSHLLICNTGRKDCNSDFVIIIKCGGKGAKAAIGRVPLLPYIAVVVDDVHTQQTHKTRSILIFLKGIA